MTRDPRDYYATPDWCADVGARLALEVCDAVGAGRVVLDPCAGDGALLRAARRAGATRVYGLELDPDLARRAGCPRGDALDLSTPWPRAEVVLINPPFSAWQSFVERAICHAPTVALLRLGALAGQGRHDWWARIARAAGARLCVLSRRPSFGGGGHRAGQTDATDYAWIVLGAPPGGPDLTWAM